MTKGSKQTKFDKDLNLEDLKAGDIIPDLHGESVEIDDNLIEQMRRFEHDTKYKAIWKGKITGHFLYFKWIEEHPEYLEEKEKTKAERIENLRKAREAKKNKKENEIEELEEEQVKDEENLLLDAIEDYKTEFGVKKVNTNSKKFKH